MRVLAHIHTFNDADIIDKTIEGVRRQTRPVDGILVVDNASADGTLDCPSVKNVAVLPLSENTGTSGAVYAGFRYALEQGYDWIWVFDADSIPEPDALAKLLDCYEAWPAELREETAFLACLPRNAADDNPIHGQAITRHGVVALPEPKDRRCFPCNIMIWSGCLYRLAAVRKIGLPNPDYVLDAGEWEYGYQVMNAGYKGFINQDAILHHNIRGYASMGKATIRIGPAHFSFLEFAPIRCYYICRNQVYFSLYEITRGRLWHLLRTFIGLGVLTLNFAVRPLSHGKQIHACVRGMWHGLRGNIAARY